MRALILAVFLSFNSWGQNFEECRADAAKFGDHVQPQQISETCYDRVKENILGHAESWSKDWTLYALAAGNILYFEKFELNAETNTLTLLERSPLAGPNSFISNVLAVEVVKDLNFAYVLNKEGENYTVSGYELMLGGGNLSPHAKIGGGKIDRASNLRADLANNELYILSAEEAWIKVFNLKAHDDSKQVEKESGLRRKIQGTNSRILNPTDLDISSGSNEIFVLENGNKVIVFDRLSDGDVLPKRSIEGESTLMVNAKEIRVDDPSNIITIVNGDGQELQFSKDAEGNVSPQ